MSDATSDAAGPAIPHPRRASEDDSPPSGNPVDLLLRRPDALLAKLDGPEAPRLLAVLAAMALGGHLVYGLVVGSFSGGMQWWAAPLKILIGVSLCGAICFPSLYIFVCLSGARARPAQVAGLLLGVFALTAVFLAGFAPVAWVFSQSATLVSFIAPIHILVWLASILASRRVLSAGLKHWHARSFGVASVWLLVLIVTCLQMTTTLRPIVGPGQELFVGKRMFFLQHWGSTISDEANAY